jgi:hypothetical protein
MYSVLYVKRLKKWTDDNLLLGGSPKIRRSLNPGHYGRYPDSSYKDFYSCICLKLHLVARVRTTVPDGSSLSNTLKPCGDACT